jgi:iron complex outermembrane receptor protein
MAIGIIVRRLLLVSMGVAPGWVWAQETADSAPGAATLQEIVVTAQRRQESLQTAALPVSALSAEQLASSGASKVQDLTRLIPALQVSQAAGPYALYFLRGVGNFNGNSLSDAAVALSVDGVYVARPSSTVGMFYDLDRVEVLKGPQGTLYGRNATGGAINVITRKPTDEFGVDAGLDIGNHDLVKVNAALNLPLSDRIAARFSAQSIDRHGYMSDGTDDENGRAARAQLRAKATASLTLNVAADFYHQGGRGPGASVLPGGQNGFLEGNPRIGMNDPRAGAVFSQTLVFPAADFLGPPLQKGLAFSPLPTHVFQNNDYWGISGTLDWATDAGTLTVIPAYRHSKLDFNSTAPSFLIAQQESDEQTSLEARFASSESGPFSYLGGVYYLDESIHVGPAIYDQEYNASVQAYATKTRSFAGFGRLRYSLTEALRLTAGARWTRDEKRLAGQYNSAQSLCLPFLGWSANPASIPPPPLCIGGVGQIVAPNPAIDLDAGNSWSRVTWRVGAEWDVGPRSLAYASVETGFKSGGFYFTHDNPVYNPEKVTAYTLGSKNRFLGNRLQLNLEAFYWDYRDQQISHIVSDSAGVVVFATQNVGKATIKGAELETQYLLTDTTLLAADAQYLDSSYDTFAYTLPNFGAPAATSCAATPVGTVYNVNCSGRTPPQSPRWTLNFGLQQTIPLGTGSIVAQANTHFQTVTLVGLEFLPQEMQGSYWWTDLNLGYHADRSRWSVTAYVENVSNTTVLNVVTPQPLAGEAIFSASVRQPRTYGVRGAVSF